MNEIITFGKGYTLNPGIKIFVKSGKEICENVTVLSCKLGTDIETFCKKLNANFFDCSELGGKYKVNDNISPYTLKIIYYYLYCKYVSKADNVYVCDFTDTYFQKNVFELVKNNKPYVTSENFPISKCPTNQTWLRVCYGEDILNLLYNYDIINGTGNVFGNRLAVIDLLKEICLDFELIMGRAGSYPIIDQACINKVVRFGQHKYNVLQNFEVFNLAHYGDSPTILKERNISVNGHIPYVIHQHDVIESVETFLCEQYE